MADPAPLSFKTRGGGGGGWGVSHTRTGPSRPPVAIAIWDEKKALYINSGLIECPQFVKLFGLLPCCAYDVHMHQVQV